MLVLLNCELYYRVFWLVISLGSLNIFSLHWSDIIKKDLQLSLLTLWAPKEEREMKNLDIQYADAQLITLFFAQYCSLLHLFLIYLREFCQGVILFFTHFRD